MPSTISPGEFRGVRGVRDILRMRKIRNEVRKYMTHNTNKISLWQQLAWYLKVYRMASTGGMRVFLMWHDGQPVGYGLITTREGKLWVSGGLVGVARGKGLGYQLFQSLTRYARFFMDAQEVWLDVRRDNFVALDLYYNLGYQIVPTNGDYYVLVYRGQADV